MIKNIEAFVRRETATAIAFILLAVFSFWSLSCESQVSSITDPEKMVTRPELQLELQTLVQLAQIRMDQLDQQDHIKAMLLNFASLTATTGQFNWSGLVPILFSILGIGALADNVRHRVELRKANDVS